MSLMSVFRFCLGRGRRFAALTAVLLVSGCATTGEAINSGDNGAPVPANAAASGSNILGKTQMSPVTGRSSRLRFKDGPTCLCSDGLGEKDISGSNN